MIGIHQKAQLGRQKALSRDIPRGWPTASNAKGEGNKAKGIAFTIRFTRDNMQTMNGTNTEQITQRLHLCCLQGKSELLEIERTALKCELGRPITPQRRAEAIKQLEQTQAEWSRTMAELKVVFHSSRQ